jgi:hypothetical protein
MLKSAPLSDHITVGFMLLLRICGTIMWCCHCKCVQLCLQTPGGSIITTCELIHYHYFLCCCFTRTLYVTGITCCNSYANMSLFHYFPYTVLLHNIQTHEFKHGIHVITFLPIDTLHTVSRHIHMPSAAPPGKKFYKTTVDLTDLKHEIQFLYSHNILILRITTTNLH